VRQATKAPVDRHANTLAAWVSLLGPGSPCFCCGSPLSASASDTDSGRDGRPELVCSRCGAGVSDSDAFTVAAPFPQRDRLCLAAA
jgi:hypothetical protein